MSENAENQTIMNKFIFLITLLSLTAFFSCASAPVEKALVAPQPPIYIMGEGNVSAEKLMLFLLHYNPLADFDFVRTLAVLYVEEAAIEGVNHDIAFAQMILETGFLRFGNLVQPESYNFAGLGATGLPGPDGLPEAGLIFPDPRTGVRAHVQHLKAYATDEPLNNELVNPRRRFVRLGSSPTIEGLAGTWAADPDYAVKIKGILRRLYDFAF